MIKNILDYCCTDFQESCRGCPFYNHEALCYYARESQKSIMLSFNEILDIVRNDLKEFDYD